MVDQEEIQEMPTKRKTKDGYLKDGCVIDKDSDDESCGGDMSNDDNSDEDSDNDDKGDKRGCKDDYEDEDDDIFENTT